ncbi:hypothetical protein SCP_0201040 [Sparassis crispa]|uniref:Uncharacterized protein n=1 Tax=Sparassis crispa TaxID=139825 RepID=A0A401G9S6_9APHY|nr:hypothetical protein SCP_0201040 [Sparassis crispa]GBE78907.1 hypothetical protein SCP_0201040 [Sparassis crispa]
MVVDSDDEDDELKDNKKEVRTKTVHFDASAIPSRSTIDEVEELAKCMHALKVDDAAYSGCYTHLVCLAPATASAWTPLSMHQQASMPSAGAPPPCRTWNYTTPSTGHVHSTRCCFFCGQPGCTIGNCPTKWAYVQAGWIIIVGHTHMFTDHSPIPWNERGLKFSVDERFGGPLPSMMTPAAPASAAPKPPSSTPVRDVPPHQAQFTSCLLVCEPIAESNAVIANVEGPVKELREPLVAATKSDKDKKNPPENDGRKTRATDHSNRPCT